MTSRWYLEKGGYPEKIFLNEHEMDLEEQDQTDQNTMISAIDHEMRSLGGTASVVSSAPSVVGGMKLEMNHEVGQEMEVESQPGLVAPSSSSVAFSIGKGSSSRGKQTELNTASLTTGQSETTGTLPPPRYLDPKYYCPICSCIFKHPIKCANEHTFCHSCLKYAVSARIPFECNLLPYLSPCKQMLHTCDILDSSWRQQTSGALCVKPLCVNRILWGLFMKNWRQK